MEENHFSYLLDSPIIGFAHHKLVLDDQGLPVDYVFLNVNKTFEKLTGLVKSEILNKSIGEVIPGFHKIDSKWIILYGDIALNGGNASFEMFSDLLKRWYRVNAYSYEKYFFTTVFVDVTEEKDAIAQLQKLSYAVEQSSVSVVITDLAGNIEYVNPKFSSLTGYSFEEVKGQNPRILKSGEQSREFYVQMWNKITKGELWQGEFHNKKKNGELFWESASVSPILDDNGITTHYLAVKEDITTKKLAEEQLNIFSKVVKQSPNMVLITGTDGIIQYVNDAYCKMSGYDSVEKIGKKFKFFTDEDPDDEQDFENLWKTIHSGLAWRGEVFDEKKNGELFWLSLTINPILGEKGDVMHYVADMQDISEKKKVEDEIFDLNLNLEKKVNERTSELTYTNEILMSEIIARKNNEAELKIARNEAEKANKAKSDFISRMSHELRTPMNSILGFAQLFAMGDLNPGQIKGVNHILNSGKHLLKLINEVLDISKIEAGRYNLHKELISIGEIISDAVDLITPLAADQQISVEVIPGMADKMLVNADKQAIIQILINLLNNAIKYNRKNGYVKIKTELLHDNEHRRNLLRISIIDSGVGIEEKNISKLFNPFERFGPNEYSTEGTGLGLNIARELIALMEGSIDVKSVYGKGSTFCIDIPCADFNEEIHYSEIESEEVYEHFSQDSEGVILYIEDNIPNTELVEQIILENRPHIKLVSDMFGVKAVSLAIENKPFLILLDLNLPDIHGIQVMKLLKENDLTKNIPVIILSADAMPHKIKKLKAAGAKNYLTKPLNVNELIEEIDKYHKPVK